VRARLDGQPWRMHPVSDWDLQDGVRGRKLCAMPLPLKHLSERTVVMLVHSWLCEG